MYDIGIYDTLNQFRHC